MTKAIDSILTLAFLILFGWATIHGLTYETFNTDAAYINTQVNSILPIISLLGNILVFGSMFNRTKFSYLLCRLIGVGLIVPLILNYFFMEPIDINSIFIQSILVLVFVGLSLTRRFTNNASI